MSDSKKTSSSSKKKHNVSIGKGVTVSVTDKQKDISLINESFEYIKSLNKKLGSIEKIKKKLSDDVSQLQDRLDTHEKNKNAVNSQKVQSVVKEEIIREVSPLLKNLDSKSLKIDVFGEVAKVIDIEIEKLRSEISSESSKTKRSLEKKFSELEMRIVDVLRENEILSKSLTKFEEKGLNDAEKKFESHIQNAVRSAFKRISIHLDSQKDYLEELRGDYNKQSTELKSLSKSIDAIKKELSVIQTQDTAQVSSLDSKVEKLKKDFSALESLIGRYENDLYGKREEEIKLLKEDKNKLVKEFTAQRDFLVDKLNSVIDNVNDFEEKVKAMEKNEIKKVDTLVKKSFEKEKNSLLELFKEFTTDSKNQSKNLINKFNEVIENVNSFEKKILDIEKQDINSLSDSLISNFKKERDGLVAEISKKFEGIEELRESYEKLIKSTSEEIKESSLEAVSFVVKEIKEDVSKQLVANTESLTRLKTQSAEAQRNLSEHVESKFTSTLNQFENKFMKQVQLFDSELKNKEKDFLKKLDAVEKERAEVVSELEKYKIEVAKLTKTYTEKLDKELQQIKFEEINFENKKGEFLAKIDSLTHARKISIEEVYEKASKDLTNILQKYRSNLEASDNSFRDTFHEKVANLHDYLEKQLKVIETKFVEKNSKEFKSKIDSEYKNLDTISRSLSSQLLQIEKRYQELEGKENDFWENLKAQEQKHADDLAFETNKIKESVEERMMSLEKHFNKRFLDYDSQFGSFKSTIIDEVEDLMKEVKEIVDSKAQIIDQKAAKMNFILGEAEKKLSSLDNVENIVETQVRDIRDEINDLRVKFEITAGDREMDSMNTLVQNLGEYEKQLLSLIEALKAKGARDEAIMNALSAKGHPRFYVQFVLENLRQEQY